MDVKVIKEIVRCKICGQKNEFYYLSDFSYGERLALYSSGEKYAYINLLSDSAYKEVCELIEEYLAGNKVVISDMEFGNIFDYVFGDICDCIDGDNIDLDLDKKKCSKCHKDEFEEVLLEPEEIVTIDIPQIQHSHWDKLAKEDKKKSVEKIIAQYSL